MNAKTFADAILKRVADALDTGEETLLDGDLQRLVEEFTHAEDPGLINFTKFDEDQRMAWGWALVSVEKGQEVIDRQGDALATSDLQDAVHGSFMENGRVLKRMHSGKRIGEVVDSIVFTKDVQQALGIDLGREGWFVGVRVDDPATWDEVKKGKLPAFSIGGSGERHAMEKTWSDAARAAAAEARANKLSAKANASGKYDHHVAASFAHRDASNVSGISPRQRTQHLQQIDHHDRAAATARAYGNANAVVPGHLRKGDPVNDDDTAPLLFKRLYQALVLNHATQRVSKEWSDAARAAAAEARKAHAGFGKANDAHPDQSHEGRLGRLQAHAEDMSQRANSLHAQMQGSKGVSADSARQVARMHTIAAKAHMNTLNHINTKPGQFGTPGERHATFSQGIHHDSANIARNYARHASPGIGKSASAPLMFDDVLKAGEGLD